MGLATCNFQIYCLSLGHLMISTYLRGSFGSFPVGFLMFSLVFPCFPWFLGAVFQELFQDVSAPPPLWGRCSRIHCIHPEPVELVEPVEPVEHPGGRPSSAEALLSFCGWFFIGSYDPPWLGSTNKCHSFPFASLLPSLTRLVNAPCTKLF